MALGCVSGWLNTSEAKTATKLSAHSAQPGIYILSMLGFCVKKRHEEKNKEIFHWKVLATPQRPRDIDYRTVHWQKMLPGSQWTQLGIKTFIPTILLPYSTWDVPFLSLNNNLIHRQNIKKLNRNWKTLFQWMRAGVFCPTKEQQPIGAKRDTTMTWQRVNCIHCSDSMPVRSPHQEDVVEPSPYSSHPTLLAVRWGRVVSGVSPCF